MSGNPKIRESHLQSAWKAITTSNTNEIQTILSMLPLNALAALSGMSSEILFNRIRDAGLSDENGEH